MIELGVLVALGAAIFRRARACGKSGAAHLCALILLWLLGYGFGAAMLGVLMTVYTVESMSARVMVLGLAMPWAGAAIGAVAAFALVGSPPRSGLAAR